MNVVFKGYSFSEKRLIAVVNMFPQELEAFGKRCDLLVREFMASEAFKRTCLIYTAFNIMDMYEKRMKILENEAQVELARDS